MRVNSPLDLLHQFHSTVPQLFIKIFPFPDPHTMLASTRSPKRDGPFNHPLDEFLHLHHIFIRSEEQLCVEVPCTMSTGSNQTEDSKLNSPSPTCPSTTPRRPASLISFFVSYTNSGNLETGTLIPTSEPEPSGTPMETHQTSVGQLLHPGISANAA